MTNHTEPQYVEHAALEQLKEHYRHCIKLSTTNKINPKNAFELQLIDFMQDIAINNPDGQMNFKIASSALDVGAKIYSNRVDCIQGVAQKVASSLMMAVDGQKGKSNNGEDQDETLADNNISGCDGINHDDDDDPDKRRKNKRVKTRKRQIKYLSDDATLSADIEAVILSEPVSTDIQDNDMTSAAALIVHNQSVEETGRPLFDPDYKETTKPRDIHGLNQISILWKNVHNAAIIEKADAPICARFSGFLFVDKTSKMQGYDTNMDESIDSDTPVDNCDHSAAVDQIEAECDFDVQNYDDGIAHDDSFGDNYIDQNDCQDLNRTLETVAAVTRSEYDHRLLNTWAGPHAWTIVRAPQTAKRDGAPRSTRKRIKLEQMPIVFGDEDPSMDDAIAEKVLRHSSAVLRKWKKIFKPQDHNLQEEELIKDLEMTCTKAAETYNCAQTPAEALKSVDRDHDYANRSDLSEEVPQSPVNYGGFDDVHDDSDDEFRADPAMNDGISAGLNTSLSQNDLEYAGEHLIEQPHTVAHDVVISYSRAAKKIDIRKLKHVMWNVLLPLENREIDQEYQTRDETMVENDQPNNLSGDRMTPNDSTKKIPSPTPSESAVHLAFSNLYGTLPVKVSHRMASDLSQSIAFVTLLHLANEKNLKLIPKQDLKDFIIEQDEFVVE